MLCSLCGAVAVVFQHLGDVRVLEEFGHVEGGPSVDVLEVGPDLLLQEELDSRLLCCLDGGVKQALSGHVLRRAQVRPGSLRKSIVFSISGFFGTQIEVC